MKKSLTDGRTDGQPDRRTDDGHRVMGKALADIVSWAKKVYEPKNHSINKHINKYITNTNRWHKTHQCFAGSNNDQVMGLTTAAKPAVANNGHRTHSDRYKLGSGRAEFNNELTTYTYR